MATNDPISPTCRKLRDLNDYCDRLPRDRRGRRTNPSTLWRFRLKGSCGIPFPAVCLGSRWLTTDADVFEWMRQVAQARAARAATRKTPPPSPSDSAAEKILRDAGILDPEEATP